MLKILLSRLQKYVNQKLPDVQAGFRKGRGTRDEIANIRWIIEKSGEFQENIYFCFINYAKEFAWSTTKCGKFFKRQEYQTTLPASWDTYMQVKKQQSRTGHGTKTDSKLGKEYVKAIYCHPAYLNYMQSTSCEMLG